MQVASNCRRRSRRGARPGARVRAALNAEAPEGRVVMLTTFNRPGYLRQAMDAGVAGFMLEDAPASELARAIRVAEERGWL